MRFVVHGNYGNNTVLATQWVSAVHCTYGSIWRKSKTPEQQNTYKSIWKQESLLLVLTILTA